MGRLLIFCLSLFLLLSGCSNPSTSNLEPALTLVERDTLIAQKYREFFQTHQGTPRAMHLLEEILELDSTNAEAWREMSIPYLKRGIPHKWYEYYQKAIEYDAENWIGWRGYCYLFFYRDYRRAIADFDATDTITPGFTDYPQAMSVHYLRGLCYYGLNEYENAQAYFQRYIDEEMAGPGFDFIDQNVYLFRGLIQQKLEDHQQAIEEFKTGLKIFEGSSDLYYHMSRSYLALGNLPLAKSSALKAEDYFKQGYYHHRPYIEVFDRIYDYDISELKSSLKLNN